MIKDHQEIVLMDGHGRFIILLLLLFFKKRREIAETIKITVIDNYIDKEKNPVVTDWHNLFFPKSINNIQDNIYNYKPTNSRLVYLNFCGIGGKEGINNLIEYLDKSEKGNNLFLSFSVLRAAKDTLIRIINQSNKKVNTDEDCKINMKEVTSSKKFKTFSITIK